MLAKDERRKNATNRKGIPSFGTVILSEFTGCVNAMGSIVRINPYTITEITTAVYSALRQDETKERRNKFKHDVEYIEKHDTENWMNSLIEDIKSGRNKNEVSL